MARSQLKREQEAQRPIYPSGWEYYTDFCSEQEEEQFFLYKKKWKTIKAYNSTNNLSKTDVELIALIYGLTHSKPLEKAYLTKEILFKELGIDSERQLLRIRKNISHIFSSKWKKRTKTAEGYKSKVYIFEATSQTGFILGISKYYKKVNLGHFCPTSYNKYENNKKNIDIESNSLQNSKELQSDKNSTTQITELSKESDKSAKFKKQLPNERKKATRGELKARVYKPFAYTKPKTLADMLHLIDGSTCDELRSKSGRPFSDNFITQLVLKMSRDHRRRPVFNYRRGFISYMVKALKHELHDAVKTGNIGFRFKANIPVNNNENQERESRSVALKPEPIELPKGEWGEICRRLIDIYDEHIYRNWLSKLIIFLDECDKFITLEVPSSFMKEWIETNYWDSIKKIAESVGLELRGISVQACLKGERVFVYGTTSEEVIDNLPGESKPNGFQKISVFEIVDKLQKS